MTVTTASAALEELVRTMEAIDRLNDKRGDLTEAEDRRYARLEARRTALEQQLQREVKDKLGVDYGVLWNAVTPSN